MPQSPDCFSSPLLQLLTTFVRPSVRPSVPTPKTPNRPIQKHSFGFFKKKVCQALEDLRGSTRVWSKILNGRPRSQTLGFRGGDCNRQCESVTSGAGRGLRWIPCIATLIFCYKFCVLKVPELVSDAQTLNRPSLLKQ